MSAIQLITGSSQAHSGELGTAVLDILGDCRHSTASQNLPHVDSILRSISWPTLHKPVNARARTNQLAVTTPVSVPWFAPTSKKWLLRFRKVTTRTPLPLTSALYRLSIVWLTKASFTRTRLPVTRAV